MDSQERDKKFMKYYRAFMAEELSRPELAKAKKDFIAANFKPAPVFIFRPRVFVPALAFGIALLFIPQLTQIQKPSTTVPTVETVAPAVMAPKPVATKAEATAITESASKVKKLSSDTGPTMVYQKVYQETPITIVWVFPSSGGQIK